ncbi:MAG TPA: LysR family transcriptional regulator [Minicystis sp.]|nr:LysR family transcriptional regulator [Minicystis sp.]
MDLDHLRAFVALARLRRFTAAARRLSVSQPTLSRHVQQLEREAGAKLVVRSPDGAVLTEAGERLLPHAERALASVDAALAEVGELAGEPRGAVAVGTLATVGAYVLPEAVAAFHRRHPGVRLSIREGFRDELERLVVGGELDLAIIQLPVRHEELAALELWQEDYVLAVPRGHRLASARRPVALTSVVDEPFVAIPGGTATSALEAACAARGSRPEIALVTDNVESVRRMVEAGLGLALVPRIMARDPRWRAALVPLAAPGVHRRVAIVHRGRGYLTVAARALRDRIAAVVPRRRPRAAPRA